MRISLMSIISLLLLPLVVMAADEMIKVGDPVPDFQLPYATAEEVNFDGIGRADLEGERYVLAFYPADWSGGCTKEMCTLRDEFKQFQDLNVEVYPVSADLVYSHHEWAKYHKLPFKLLADQTREFGKAMGVYLPQQGMFQRSVFVVGPDGKIEYVDYNYSLADDSDFKALTNKLADLTEQK